MNTYWPLLIFGGVIIGMLVIAGILAEKRRRQLGTFAERVGLFYAPDADDVHEAYSRLEPFGRGSSQRSWNLIHGRRGEIDWQLFDYRYQTGSGKNRQTHRFGVAAARVPLWFRRLVLRPEGFLDKVASMAGFDDINFESNDFSRRYHVSCSDRKYAYDMIHPQMIEFLLQFAARHWQISGNFIVVHRKGSFKAAELEEVIAAVEGFMQRIPDYVRQDDPLRRSDVPM